MDRTKWYSVNYDKLHDLEEKIERIKLDQKIPKDIEQEIKIDETTSQIDPSIGSKRPNGKGQNDPTNTIDYPYNTSDITTETIYGSDEPDQVQISPEKKQTPPDPQPSNVIAAPRPDILVRYWNRLDNPNLYRHTQTDTKTYSQIRKLLNALRAGVFHKITNIEEEFLDKHEIPKKYLRQKWTDRELKRGLSNLSKYFTKGYYPGVSSFGKDDKIKKTGLLGLIYNKNTGSSMLLWMLKETPRLYARDFGDQMLEVTEKYRALFNGLTERQVIRLRRGANQIIDFHDCLVDDIGELMSYTSFGSWVGGKGNPLPLVEEHIRWLETWKNISVNHINPKSWYWERFQLWFEEEHGYKLNPTENDIESYRASYSHEKRDEESRAELEEIELRRRLEAEVF